MERKIHFREKWRIFWGILGEAELILWIGEQRKNTFRELRNFLSRIWGDQCIIFKDQGSTDPPPGGPQYGVVMALCCSELQSSVNEITIWKRVK